MHPVPGPIQTGCACVPGRLDLAPFHRGARQRHLSAPPPAEESSSSSSASTMLHLRASCRRPWPVTHHSPSGPGGETRRCVQRRCRNNNRRSYYYKELIRAGAAGAGNKNKTIPLGSRHHPPRMIIQRAGRQTSKNSRTELRRADGNPPPHRAL